MDNCDCSCHLIPIKICVPNKICCCCPCRNVCNIDCEISNLECQVNQKLQNEKDYCSLESKFRQLQNDIQLLSEEKLRLEYQLRKSGNDSNKLMSDLQCENNNLKKELKDKELLNDKLYSDNNNLFHLLESKTKDNQNLRDQICKQEDILQKELQ